MSFTLEMIEIGALSIDVRYQRTIKEPTIRKLLKVFDESCVKVISVSRRSDGSMWVYDGMHSLELCKRMGHEHVACKVVNGDSVKESKWFDLLNGPGATKASPSARQKAQEHYGDPVAVEARTLLDAYGLEIATGGGRIGATSAINQIKEYLQSDKSRLIRAMDMIDHLWSEQPDAWTHVMVRGAYEVAGTGVVDTVEQQLAKRKVTPRMLLEVASALQSQTGANGSGCAYIKKAYMKLAKVHE